VEGGGFLVIWTLPTTLVFVLRGRVKPRKSVRRVVERGLPGNEATLPPTLQLRLLFNHMEPNQPHAPVLLSHYYVLCHYVIAWLCLRTYYTHCMTESLICGQISNRFWQLIWSVLYCSVAGAVYWYTATRHTGRPWLPLRQADCAKGLLLRV